MDITATLTHSREQSVFNGSSGNKLSKYPRFPEQHPDPRKDKTKNLRCRLLQKAKLKENLFVVVFSYTAAFEAKTWLASCCRRRRINLARCKKFPGTHVSSDPHEDVCNTPFVDCRRCTPLHAATLRQLYVRPAGGETSAFSAACHYRTSAGDLRAPRDGPWHGSLLGG